MAKDGTWKSKHQGKMLIAEMQDTHLVSSIQYIRKVIMTHYTTVRALERRGTYMSSLLDKWEELLVEAAKRHLTFDSSQEPPHPDDFKGQKYEKRSPVQPPRGCRPRASRSVSI